MKIAFKRPSHCKLEIIVLFKRFLKKKYIIYELLGHKLGFNVKKSLLELGCNEEAIRTLE